MSEMDRLWFTQTYLYRFYTPELIRLSHDEETNAGPRVVDPTKTIAASYSQGIREFKKLRRQLQRKRHIKIELCVNLSLLRLFHVVHVVQNR